MAQRFVTGVILALALCAFLYLGGWFLVAAVFLVYALALYEELTALRHINHRPVWWASFAALIVSVPLILTYSYVAILPILVAFSFCVLLQVMLREHPDLVDVMVSLLPIFTLVLPAISILGILETSPRSLQLFFLLLMFAIAIGGDIFAYSIGTRIGGKKLCPNISPHKTVSGAIGGLVGSIFGAALVALIFPLFVQDVSFPPLWATLLAALLGAIAAQTGDLLASMVKRHCDIKDFGNLFPGHGGMLDRLDSVSFSAIVIYSYRVILLLAAASPPSV